MLSTFWTTVFIQPLFNLLVFLYNVIPGHDFGVAVIILTLIIRFILYPSSKKAIVSQRGMQELQPEMEKIKEKYKDDRQKQTEATLKFYKEKKISPFGSCLPILVQMPILIALYWVLRQAGEGESLNLLYSFISRPESLNTTFLGIVDLTRPEVYVLPVLAGISQFVQSYMIFKKSKKDDGKKKQDPASAISKQMIYIFPVITIFFAASLPSAIALYWITTNLFSIVQQYIIMKNENEEGKPQVVIRRKKQ